MNQLISMLSTAIKRHFTNKLLASSKVQVSEFDIPTDIVTHCPSIETRFPFHLAGCLFEHPPDPDKAVECHDGFRKLLTEISGAKVWTVREILMQFSEAQLREFLIRFSHINFCIPPGLQSEETQLRLKKEYIDFSLSSLSKDDLIDLILLHPTLTIDFDKNSSTGFRYENIPLSPLANLTFTRDQQITTAKGVIIGRFGARQRTAENDLMSAVWPLLGINPIGRIKNPGKLEGGDFIPVDKDICMLGIGLRSNFASARQLMDENLLGTKRFLVVEDKVDCDQQRMHLDTYFNLVDPKLCVCVDAIAEDDPHYVRIAHEFVQHDDKIYREEKVMPFGRWLQQEGYNVVKANFKQQEDYFLNLVHLGIKNNKSQVLTINPDVEREIRKAGFKGDAYYYNFSHITSMYGGAHCATQVLRTPSK